MISLRDTSQADNNTSVHPGEGLILPIDAHPEPLIRQDNPAPWGASQQAYGSTFGVWRTDPIELHVGGAAGYHPSLPAVRKFDAQRDYTRTFEERRHSYMAPFYIGCFLTPAQSRPSIPIMSNSSRGWPFSKV